MVLLLEVGNVEKLGRRLDGALAGLARQAVADLDVPLQPAEETRHFLDLRGLHSRLLGALGRHDQTHELPQVGARCTGARWKRRRNAADAEILAVRRLDWERALHGIALVFCTSRREALSG